MLGDVVTAARNRVRGASGPGGWSYSARPVTPGGQVASRFYIALGVEDEPGVLARIAAGGRLLVFARPAALQDPAVRGSLRASRLAAVAIDEAHALSEWSHELSPALASLPQTVGELGPAALVAHVPVAVPVVARDAAERLLLRHAVRIELPLLRPHVTLECVPGRGDARHRALLALVSRRRRPGHALRRPAADVDAVHPALPALPVSDTHLPLPPTPPL